MRTDLVEASRSLLSHLGERGLRLGVAESCTGGLLGAALTAVDGASKVFEGGFLTYSNQAKMDFLGVEEALLHAHGAVSSEVAEAMAVGVLHTMEQCDLGLSITGVAGAGSKDKPTGLVYIGLATRAKPSAKIASCCHNFTGERNEIRHLSVLSALDFAKNL